MTDEPSWLAEAEDHLEAALEAEDTSQKNYYIRAALQQVTVKRRDTEA